MIQIHKLYKSYGSTSVLRGIDLEVMEAETLVILGRSGVGKSVLLRLIMGLEPPDSGTITIEGCEITSPDISREGKPFTKMGMLFQASALFDSMTVSQNVGFYFTQHIDTELGRYLKPDELKQRVYEVLSLVGLEKAGDLMPSELSGGMKKRVALARLLAYQPSILFIDEPTTGLDPITAMQINELIVSLQKRLRATCIVVTHDIGSTFHIADRIALNHEGKIAYIAKKEEFSAIEDPLVQAFLKENAYVNVGAIRK